MGWVCQKEELINFLVTNLQLFQAFNLVFMTYVVFASVIFIMQIAPVISEILIKRVELF